MTQFNAFLLAGLLAGCFSPLARADADDSFNVYVATGAQSDSNLFRQASNAQSDTVASSSVTLSYSKPLAQQRVSLQATLVDYRYAKNNSLDYNAINYSGAWNWALTHRLTGVLSLAQTEAQNSFVDYSSSTAQTRPNIRRNRTNRLTAEWQVAGGWRAIAGLTNNQQRNSDSFNAENGYVLNTWEAGGKYIWPAGNYLQLVQREGKGEYTDRDLIGFDELPRPRNPQYDTEFTQSETEARLYVPLTGKTTLSTRLAHQARKHEHFPQRDYAMNIGALDVNWLPSGKISLKSGVRREVAAYQTFFTSYYLTDGFNLQPYWQISAKVGMRLRYDWQRRKYDGELINGLPDRRDFLQTVSLGVEWSPVRWATLSTSVQRDTRKSNQLGGDFESNMLSLNANLSF